MAVHHQMAAGTSAALEAGNDVGIVGLGRHRAMGDAFLVQEGTEDVGGPARVARRVGGVDAREALQEIDLAVALHVEQGQQFAIRGHVRARLGAGASCTIRPSLITARQGAPPMA
jgi:hypothetical protein